ncbi:hypothetical protein MMPV_009896 [Pyropia vietnamensis]
MDPQRPLLPGAAASIPGGVGRGAGAAAPPPRPVAARQTVPPAHASATGGPPSEGATGGGAGSSGGGGAGAGSAGGAGVGGGKRGQVAGEYERRSDFERQVSTIREQVERVRANLAKAEQILDAHDMAGVAEGAAGGVPPPGGTGGVVP